MKYTYTTATGTTEIEVDAHYHDLLISMDREEYNSDRKHSRRYPISLERCSYEGEWFADGTDILGDLIRAENYGQLQAAILQLTPEQRTLIEQIYIQNKRIIEIAQADGVTEAAIRNRLKKIYDRLKNNLG